MSVKQTRVNQPVKPPLEQELRRLEALPIQAGGQRQLDVPLAQGRLRGQLTAIGPLACGFDHLTFETSQLAEADAERLRLISDRLSERLSYLLEPIRPVESDAEQGVVQLRSDPPSRDEERGRSYYELLARRGGSLRLSRFRKVPGQPRQAVPAEVTREVLYRLAEDLVQAVE